MKERIDLGTQKRQFFCGYSILRDEQLRERRPAGGSADLVFAQTLIKKRTYNQIDNDLRVRRVLSQSSGAAEASMRAMWAPSPLDAPVIRICLPSTEKMSCMLFPSQQQSVDQ